jgi:V/A-type H+-transporting ATPase subunit D
VADVKLTKNELREQQTRLAQLEKYLPTLQLKKAMLQVEVTETRLETQKIEQQLDEKRKKVEEFSGLLATKSSINPLDAVKVKKISKRYENIAGVEVPYFESIEFEPFTYSLFETDPWIDAAVIGLRFLAELRENIKVTLEKKQALEKELREVAIRVNLFEKILIPRALDHIKTIKVFLGDQQLAAVCRAKVAKNKIVAAKAKVSHKASESIHA